MWRHGQLPWPSAYSKGLDKKGGSSEEEKTCKLNTEEEDINYSYFKIVLKYRKDTYPWQIYWWQLNFDTKPDSAEQ